MSMTLSNVAHGVLMNSVGTFQLTQHELADIAIAKAVQPPTAVTPAAATYWVMLINTSGICITRARTRPVGSQQWGGFFATQRICRNCDKSYDECFKQQSWTPVMSTNCDVGAFELMIIDDPDPNGNARGAIYTISPNCGVAGGVIGLG
jgi:hypothetical protein